jgi:4-amino-4-deoxy-L-arabinose transferase-like glycosyltransferase
MLEGNEPAPRPGGDFGPLAVAAVFAAFLVPFLAKPFHIDDPMYVWAAQQIAANPLDFYGFPVNWHGTTTPMWQVMKNPPLVSYYLALVGSQLGWSEVAMHGALAIVAILLVVGTWSLARTFTRRPGLAALAAAVTPVFLVSSTTVMSDVLMLCLWVWSLDAWTRGVRDGRQWLLALGAAGAAAAALTKYFGMGLLPLLALYGALRDRRFWRWAPWLLLPVAVLGAYQLATEKAYGRGLLLDASSYASAVRARAGWEAGPKLIIGISFVGACFATAAWLGPWLWSRRALATWVAVTALAAVSLAALGHVGAHPLRDAGGVRWALVGQVAVALATGISILVLAARDVARDRSAESLLLLAWMAGTLFFAIELNWSVNGRALLPMAPAVGILLARRVDLGRPALALDPRWALVPAAVLSLVVAWADLRLARDSRDAAAELAARLGHDHGTVWFQGHWGFQYYAQLLGLRPMDFRHPAVHAGERIVKPDGITNPIELPPGTVQQVGQLLLDGPTGLTTMAQAVGAGFYSDVWGPLPFAFGDVPRERYVIYEAIVPLIEPR